MGWYTDPTLWESLKPLARQKRHEPTPTEEILWQHLRNNQLGYKFRRQHGIERFIVDFYCAEAKLVIEVDGPVHQYQKEEDLIRQEYLVGNGLQILRFTNEEVTNSVDEVMHQISCAVHSPSPFTERGPGGEVEVLSVTRLEYCQIPHDPTLEAACIAPYHSCYYAELEFTGGEQPVTRVTRVVLIINGHMSIEADRFNPIRLEKGILYKTALTFPVKEHLAVKMGTYEVQAYDVNGKMYSCNGRLPVT